MTDFGRPRPVSLLLTLGISGCAVCLPDLIERHAHEWTDDGLCEVCGRHASRFHPAALALGDWLVTVETCPRCLRFLNADGGRS